MSKTNHFPEAVDPVVFEEYPWLTPDESEFCAQVAAVMFMAWSGAKRVMESEKREKYNYDLDDVIINQLKIMIWG